MVYENYYKNSSSKDINDYIKYSIDRIYALLNMYEEEDNYKNLHCYLRRIIIEFRGFSDLYGSKDLISLINTLNGIEENIGSFNHSEMKRLVFHCISILKKMEVK